MQKVKRISFSAVTLLLALSLAVAGSTAYFSDTETSTNNILQAGAIDLTIDNESYYNGEVWPETTWQLKDLEEGDLFFNFQDLKPGDWGEDTISLHVTSNSAWACMDMTLTANDENVANEPELSSGDSPDDTNTRFDGELGEDIQLIFWWDDGDNVLEDDEVSKIFAEGSAEDILDSTLTLADSENGNIGGGGALQPDTDYFIGKAWCLGELVQEPVAQGQNSPTSHPGIVCNGAGASNLSQTDVVYADLTFVAVQERHNGDFVCGADVLDTLDIGNVTDEADNNLLGWSDEWVKPGWGGNYGGGSSDTSLRLLMGHGDPDGCTVPDSKGATFVMRAGSSFATSLTLEHLAGAVNDGFEVYINGILEGSYVDDGSSAETWKTTTFTFSPVVGDVDVRLVATNPSLSWCNQWGQVAFSNATLE